MNADVGSGDNIVCPAVENQSTEWYLDGCSGLAQRATFWYLARKWPATVRITDLSAKQLVNGHKPAPNLF